MTRLSSLEINCDCGHRFKAVYYASINTFIDPDFDTNIIKEFIDGSLHDFKCENCGKIHHIRMKVLINCPKGMFWVSTTESPENIKKILTHYGVLDKDGNVVNGFTERLESWLKKSPEERKRDAEAADEKIKKLRDEFFDGLKKALENSSDEKEQMNNKENNEVN